MQSYTRTNKKTGDTTELDLNRAIHNFITDSFNYAVRTTPDMEEDAELDDYLDDMLTNLETSSMLQGMDDEGVDAGDFIYTKN